MTTAVVGGATGSASGTAGSGASATQSRPAVQTVNAAGRVGVGMGMGLVAGVLVAVL